MQNRTRNTFARSMTEAFGPYADRTPIHPMQDNEPLRPLDIADRIVCAGAIACAIAVVIFALIGWL